MVLECMIERRKRRVKVVWRERNRRVKMIYLRGEREERGRERRERERGWIQMKIE